MRKFCLAAAFCIAAIPAFAAPPDTTGDSLKPGAADLTGPVRGARAQATPPKPGKAATATAHKRKAKHQTPPVDAPK